MGDTDDVGVERKDRAATDFPGKEVDPKDDLSYATYGGTRGTRLAAANPSLELRATAMTLKPAVASVRAIASPSPRLPPVTMTLRMRPG